MWVSGISVGFRGFQGNSLGFMYFADFGFPMMQQCNSMKIKHERSGAERPLNRHVKLVLLFNDIVSHCLSLKPTYIDALLSTVLYSDSLNWSLGKTLGINQLTSDSVTEPAATAVSRNIASSSPFLTNVSICFIPYSIFFYLLRWF